MCYIYSDADFRPNEKFDGAVAEVVGIRLA
jgi:hypothetical protein